MAYRIVLTGGPGSGKSVLMARLRTLPEFAEFVFFDELARQLLAADPTLRDRRTDLHLAIWQQQTAREKQHFGRSFFTDRGTLDAFAFHPELLDIVDSTVETEYARYTDIVHLGSAARLGEPYYVCDDVRIESCADALIIESALQKAWGNHPRYQFIPAQVDAEQKKDSAIAVIRQILARPVNAHQ